MADYRLSIPQLDQHAQAIGYVCITWGWLEGVIDHLLNVATPLPRGDAAECITANADMERKILMLKGVAFLRRKDDQWFNDLCETLDYISNTLRNERNRFVHDRWTQSPTPVKRQAKTSLSKPQAFVRSLTTHKNERVPVDEVWDLVRRIEEAHRRLENLRLSHKDWPRRLL
jgi:hypothetical protein